MESKQANQSYSKFFNVVVYTLIALSAIIFTICIYKITNFGSSQIDEIIFYFNNGLNHGQMSTFGSSVLLNLVYMVLIFVVLVLPMVDSWRQRIIAIIPKFLAGNFLRHKFKDIKRRSKILYTAIVFISSIACLISSFGIVAYAKSIVQTTNFYEQNYVDPKTTKITFPNKKRNLIYIYLESMENTMASKVGGGMAEKSIIPELEAMALDKNNVSFSNKSQGLGGAVQAHGTHWTVAGITAQSMGIPLKTNLLGSKDGNYMSNYDQFLPGGFSLGDVLKDAGYNQTFMIGSNAKFGGRDKLFSQHGNYNIYDYYHAKAAGKFKDDYFVWWGYEDKKLFEFAKQELGNLSQQDKPFNLQLLTVDTHYTDGYLDETCAANFAQRYDNVHACSSLMVGKFIDWVKQQPFYENTTIIVTGDHLGMRTAYYEDMIAGQDYTRTIYNTFINSAIKPKNQFNRAYTSFDMYPTTLAAIGAKIEGERLALGTNLFSGRQTLLEEIGSINTLNDELSKRSRFYEKTIMLGK